MLYKSKKISGFFSAFSEVGEHWWMSQAVLELTFGHENFKILTEHPRGYIKETAGYLKKKKKSLASRYKFESYQDTDHHHI